MIGSGDNPAPKKKAGNQQKLTKRNSVRGSNATLRGAGDRSKKTGKPRSKAEKPRTQRASKGSAPLQSLDLRENELLYRSLVDEAQDAIFVIARDLRVQYANGRAGRLFDVLPADLIGIPLNDLFPAPVAERQKKALKHVLKTGETYVAETRIPYPGGEVWTSTVLSPIRDSHGTITGVLGIARDIENIKAAEAALAASEATNRSIVENSTQGIVISVDGILVFANPAMCDILGYALDELLSFSAEESLDLLHPDDLPKARAREYARARGEPVENPVVDRIIRKDGGVRWIEAYISEIDFQGHTARLSTVIDVTERKLAEEALQESQDVIRSAMDNSAIGMALVSPDGRFLQVNRAACEMVGYSEAEMLGLNFQQISHPEDNAADVALMREALDGRREAFQMEKRYLHKNGELIWILLTASLVRGSDGQPRFFVSQTQDITERKLAEGRLRASEERFRALIEKGTDGISLIDPQGVALYHSPSVGRIFGVPEQGLLGQNMFELLHPDDLAPAQDLFSQLLSRPGGSLSAEYRLLNVDKGWRWLAATATNLVHDPSVGAVVVNYRDVTERKRAEQALQESEEHFRSLYQNATVGLYRTTPDGRILLANPALVKMLGYANFEEFAACDLERDVYASEYPRSRFRKRLEAEGEVRGLVATWKRKDGSLIYTRESARVIRDAENKITYYEGTVEDITERKLAELAVQQSRRQLEVLISNLPGMAYRCRNDAAWTMEFASDGCKTLTGYDREDLLDNNVLTFEEVIHPEDRQRTRQEIETAIAKGEPYEITYRILKPNHEERWIWDKGRLVETTEAGLGYMEGFMTDITELVNRQRALETLHAGGLTLGKSLNPQEIGDGIIRVLQERLDWHHAAVRLRRDGTDEIELLAFSQPHAEPDDHHQTIETARSRISRLGEGVSGWVIQHGETVRSGNLATDPRYVAVFQNMASGLYVPINSAGRTIGCISVEDDRADAFGADDERLLTTLASQAAVALENARLFDAERLRRQDAETLQKAAASLASSLEVEKLVGELLDGLAKVIAHDSATVFIKEGDYVRAMASRGLPVPEAVIDKLFPMDEIFGRVFETRRPVIIDDVQQDPNFADWGSQALVRGWMGVPLIAGGVTTGFLTLDSNTPGAYSESQVEMAMAFASHAAAAIQNARMYEETRRRADEFAILYETTRGLAAPQDAHQVLQTVVERATELMRASVGGIYLFDPVSNELEVAVSVGFPDSLRTRLAIGEGAAGRVAQTHEPLIIDDYMTWEGRSAKYDGVPMHAILEVPMLYSGELIGVLSVNEMSGSGRKFSEDDARLLSLFASAAASTVYSARLFDQLQQRLQQLSALHSIDMVISASTDLRVNLKVILETALRQLKADAVSVLLLNPVTLNLEYAAGEGFESLEISRSMIRLGEGAVGRIALSKETLILPNLAMMGQDFPRQKMLEVERFTSYIGVPLVAKGQMKGILEVFHRTPFEPNDDWMDFLNLLSGQTAIAVDNSLLFENLERLNAELVLAYDATIEGWSQALEMRGSEAHGHSRRVLDWTLNLMHEMGVRERDLQHVRRGTLLHDIGKMGIPDEILHKPAALTDTEWEVMRRHPQYAYDLLAPIAYLRPALDIPYSHHEKWDGTGYPRGLQGEEIPLSARIFAVVDVYDALTSDRPYRDAWSHEAAVDYIQSQSGIQFDPQIVVAFMQMIRLEKHSL